ncbi:MULTISPECIES: hypothetical protein [unclassified Sulfitobacter]|uniref:hypothetical protein n=1 Tax=unclassified Sulfitobacter TaxID=196795 RepID=UPI000B1D5768|nr:MULTISPECIES: hypothetical protein [unclassified Sulfitobacter]
MLEAILSEQLTSFGLIGVEVLVIVGSLYAIWPERQKKSDIDVDAAVRNAPYHLLKKL